MSVYTVPLRRPDTRERVSVLLDRADAEELARDRVRLKIMVRKGYPAVYVNPGSEVNRAMGFAPLGRQVLSRYLLGLHKGDPVVIDHENRNPFDNRRENLRPTTTKANQVNRSMAKNNTSGYKGVGWSERKQRWIGMVQYTDETGRTRMRQKHFTDPVAAAHWYDENAPAYLGPTVTTNASLGLL